MWIRRGDPWSSGHKSGDWSSLNRSPGWGRPMVKDLKEPRTLGSLLKMCPSSTNWCIELITLWIFSYRKWNETWANPSSCNITQISTTANEWATNVAVLHFLFWRQILYKHKIVPKDEKNSSCRSEMLQGSQTNKGNDFYHHNDKLALLMLFWRSRINQSTFTHFHVNKTV